MRLGPPAGAGAMRAYVLLKEVVVQNPDDSSYALDAAVVDDILDDAIVRSIYTAPDEELGGDEARRRTEELLRSLPTSDLKLKIIVEGMLNVVSDPATAVRLYRKRATRRIGESTFMVNYWLVSLIRT